MLFIHVIVNNKVLVSTSGPAKVEVLKSKPKISDLAISSHFHFSSVIFISLALICHARDLFPKPFSI
jgi:hypothetical protein